MTMPESSGDSITRCMTCYRLGCLLPQAGASKITGFDSKFASRFQACVTGTGQDSITFLFVGRLLKEDKFHPVAYDFPSIAVAPVIYFA